MIERIYEGVAAAAAVRVTGQAYVLHRDDDQFTAPEGAIIVARKINPEMAPMFWRIRGVLVEEGGAVQHAVTLAHELGLPCIVGLDGATKNITTGDTLEIDGDSGRVTHRSNTGTSSEFGQ